MENEVLVCEECGSLNVQVKAWVNANTGIFVTESDDKTGWCEDCNVHVELMPQSYFEICKNNS